MLNPALPCPEPLDLPATGPMPPLYAALVEIAGVTYAAGIHTTEDEAATVADVLAGLHLSVTSHGAAELVTVGMASEIAAANDSMSTGLGRVA